MWRELLQSMNWSSNGAKAPTRGSAGKVDCIRLLEAARFHVTCLGSRLTGNLKIHLSGTAVIRQLFVNCKDYQIT
jgi:hypothetical protein